jgi:hypothetical protein
MGLGVDRGYDPSKAANKASRSEPSRVRFITCNSPAAHLSPREYKRGYYFTSRGVGAT